MSYSGEGATDTHAQFKVDIKRLSKDDKSFAESMFRHRCQRGQRHGTINLDTCKKVIEDCKRKITIPPSAIALMGEEFENVNNGREEIDVNQFLAILSRLINHSEAAKRHRNRKSHGTDFGTSIHGLQRMATAVGRNVGTFLGVMETNEVDPSLEIFQERQRRLTQRRAQDRKSVHTRKRTVRDRARQFVQLPGSQLYEADYDEDPEEQPLELLDLSDMHSVEAGTGDLSSPGTTATMDELSSIAGSGRGGKVPPALPGFEEDAVPPLPSRDAGAPPLPSRGASAPPLPGRDRNSVDSDVPPLPSRGSALPPLPGRDDSAPPLPGRDTGAPPLPGRGDGAPPLPGRDTGAPPLPGRDTGAPPLPGRDSTAPPLPGRGGDIEAVPPLPGRDMHGKPPLLPRDSISSPLVRRESSPLLDDSVPPLPSREGKGDVKFGSKAAQPLPSRDGKPTEKNVVPLPSRDYGKDFIETKEEAIAYYRRRAAKERTGSVRHKKKKEEVPEEDYKTARTKSVKDRLKKKFLKKKVETMPVFSPWMIYLITYAQLIVLVVLVHRGDFDTIAIEPKFNNYNLTTLTTRTGFEITSRYKSANLWIGPTDVRLIHNGATFPPCMRKDGIIYQRYRRVAAIDAQSRAGCCVKSTGNTARAVYTNERKCTVVYGPSSTFYQEACSSLRNRFVVSNAHSACCNGFQGHCQMLTLPDCTSAGGTYHRNKTCLEVNCLQGLCGFGGLAANASEPFAPLSPNQWWRLFTSLFVHHGIVHVVLVGGVQVYIGRRIERSAGWLRIFLIYFISGMMGNVAAGYASPYTIMTGGGPGVAGLLSVLFIELFNMWKLVRDPVNELMGLCFYMALLFIIGTLPHLNNFSHIGGFVFGLLISVILLPYVSFGKWAVRRKRIIVGVCFTLLIILIITMLLFFYLVQSSEFCPKCDNFNCIDYTRGFCLKFLPTPASDAVIFSENEATYYRTQEN